MFKAKSKQVLSLVLALAMVCSLAITTAFAAGTDSASGWWSDEGNYDTSWYDDTQTNFTISSAEELAGLAVLVSEGNTFANKTVTLTANVDLSAHYWRPIGGDFTYNGSTPGGNAFAGTFNAGKTEENGTLTNYKVSGMTIVWNLNGTTPDNTAITSANYGGFGLFGYVDGGVIKNVDVSGSITSDAAAFCTGGVVGYLAGSVYHCNSSVDIDVNNGSPAGAGGIAGVVENVAGGTYYVQYCSNTGAVGGRTRVGGIVGAVYCKDDGGVVVDKCWNTGTMTTHSTANKAYLGGIVGYCRGYITNCYSQCKLISASGHYMAGLAGLLQGAAPQAKLENCYTVPTFVDPKANYDYTAFASVDNSSTLPITRVLWVDSGDVVNQNYGTGWGLWTLSGPVSGPDLQNSSAQISVQTGTTTVSSTTGTVLGSSFLFQGSSYPVLAWQVNGVKESDFSKDSSGGEVVDKSVVYLDGTKTVNGDGTQASPYNNLPDALANVEGNGTIKVSGTTTITGELALYNTVTIECAEGFTGTMFVIDTAGTVRLTTATFQGSGSNTIFQVDKGTLQLRSSVTLKDCGIAVDIFGGTVEANRGDITAANYSFKVEKSAAVLSLASARDLTISGTIYLCDGAFITADDPIPGNITVECEAPLYGTVIAKSTANYTLTAEDAAKITVTDKHYKAVVSTAADGTVQLVLNFSNEVFVDGKAAANGDGTQANPYNNLNDAIQDALANYGTVIVTNTVTISAPAAISADVTITRDSNYTADGSPMFVIDVPNDGSVSLGKMVVSGNGGGIFRVLNGWLVLDDGITLKNATAAVGLHNENGCTGSVEIRDAVITNADYSVWVGGSENTFLLNSTSASIEDPVYLGTGGFITVNVAISNEITVVSAVTTSGTVIAKCATSAIAQASVGKITIDGKSLIVPLRSTDIRIV